MRLASLHLQLKRVAHEQNIRLAVSSQPQRGNIADKWVFCKGVCPLRLQQADNWVFNKLWQSQLGKLPWENLPLSVVWDLSALVFCNMYNECKVIERDDGITAFKSLQIWLRTFLVASLDLDATFFNLDSRFVLKSDRQVSKLKEITGRCFVFFIYLSSTQKDFKWFLIQLYRVCHKFFSNIATAGY